MTREEAAQRFREKAEDHYYVPKLREMYQMAADALSEEPRKTGKWIEGRTLEKCSICGKKGFSGWSYCPGCGAKMQG